MFHLTSCITWDMWKLCNVSQARPCRSIAGTMDLSLSMPEAIWWVTSVCLKPNVNTMIARNYIEISISQRSCTPKSHSRFPQARKWTIGLQTEQACPQADQAASRVYSVKDGILFIAPIYTFHSMFFCCCRNRATDKIGIQCVCKRTACELVDHKMFCMKAAS